MSKKSQSSFSCFPCCGSTSKTPHNKKDILKPIEPLQSIDGTTPNICKLKKPEE